MEALSLGDIGFEGLPAGKVLDFSLRTCAGEHGYCHVVLEVCEETDDVEFSHEAKIGKISDKAIFYLMSRGLSEQDARAMIVRGFASPISKALPVEYAVEMNNLINLELEGF